MARKKHHEEHENHERWLVSYADFMTLLFAFFVVMYAVSRVDNKRIVQAAKKAEGKSSGQIRVFIQRWKFEGDALPRAERKFFQLGMQKTISRNAVLIFVAPREQKYAVVGDVGVHEKCGEAFWKKVVKDMRAPFENEDFNRAIILAISEVGKVLAAHFPRTGDTINELPDEIVQG